MTKAKYSGRKAPSFPWYYRDWLSDTKLRKCSPATRGIWFDILCYMWDEPIRGIWEGTKDDLMRACACTRNELDDFFSQCFRHDFAEVSQNSNGNVTLINRRMYKAEKARNDNVKRQQQYRIRHNVTLWSQANGHSFLLLLLFLYPPPNPYPPLPTEDKKGVITPLCPVDKIVELYHKSLPTLPKVRTKGKKLKARLGQRWREYPDLEWWAEYFRFVAESRFLTGKKTDWSANLFWLTGPENIEKVLNNTYHRDQGGMTRYTAQNLETLRNWKEKEK